MMKIKFKDLFYENTHPWMSDLQQKIRQKVVNASTIEEAEKWISKDGELSLQYAKHVLHTRFEKGEDAIAKAPDKAYAYAFEIKEGRVEKIENTIAEKGFFSLAYARNVLNGRFEKGEEAIAKDVENAYSYAFYIMAVNNVRIDVIEQAFLEHPTPSYALKYATDIIGERWPEAEEKIFHQSETTKWEYLEEFWPRFDREELEKLLTNEEIEKLYEKI